MQDKRNLRILLIYPYFLDDRLYAEDVGIPPIGLYYIGALLKEHGYDVEILNWHDINKRPHEIEKILKDRKPDVIGFSIVHANRWGGIDIARIAKKALPGVKIVFGGIGATFLWEHLLTHFTEIDYVILGEGEYSFLDLLRQIGDGNEVNPRTIKGIAFREGEEIVRTESAAAVTDLNQLPMPSKYFTFQHVISSRGCPSNCTFCGSARFWGRRVRLHSPDYFVEQLERLHKKGVSFFYISDDTFTMREDRVIQICRKILEKGLTITWFAISRVNFVSEEMLYWMRKAGCIQISFGVESGSEKIRETLNKGIKTEDIKRAFKLTSKYGILPRAYFIYGSPGETPETIRETIDLIREIKPLSVIFYILDVFPGTSLYEDFKDRTKSGDDIWLKRIEDIMYFESDKRLSKEQILSFGDELRSEFYKNLPEFTEALDLIDRDDLREDHADFLSRLAMTFSHGDYATIEAIPEKEKVAEKLYSKALSYSPNLRAYLGLGIIKQKKRKYEESIAVLLEARKYHPESEQIAICLGVSYMNVGRFGDALKCFQLFPRSQTAQPYIDACYQAMGK